MTDEKNRGIVTKPGRSGAFTGNNVEDSNRIIHGYAKDLEASQDRERALQAALVGMRQALNRVVNEADTIPFAGCMVSRLAIDEARQALSTIVGEATARRMKAFERLREASQRRVDAIHEVVVGSLGSRKRELDAHLDIVMILEQLEAMGG